MPEWFDQHTALYHRRLPTFAEMQQYCDGQNALAARPSHRVVDGVSITEPLSQVSYHVYPPTVADGLCDFRADFGGAYGFTDPVHIVGERVESNSAAEEFVNRLTDAVSQQAAGDGRDVVLESLAETVSVIQAFVSGKADPQFEFDLLLPFASGLGFFADSTRRTLDFYEFSHDSFLCFQHPAFFADKRRAREL